MTIGVDISSLQGPHRMRGIGYTLINIINNLPSDIRKQHHFVFYMYTTDSIEEVLSILELKDMSYELRSLEPLHYTTKQLPGKLRLLTTAYNQLLRFGDLFRGDPRIKDLSSLDVFLQTDQAMPLPGGKSVKKALILYDIIPYILEWDYMWSYRTARRKGVSRKAALRCQGRRIVYRVKTRINCHRADQLISISNSTKEDFVKYMGISESRIAVIPLGVEPPRDYSTTNQPDFRRFESTSWGYTPRDYSFETNDKFLLFVGGADPRRKLEDLVTAFNNLRAQGHEVKLVLAGDSMQGPRNIATGAIQNALLNSSYIDEVIFLGFTTDDQRGWLYNNALAFVFPSRYEGFGLPVLEAMSYGCPVISYRNRATEEVAEDSVLYAEDSKDIYQQALTLLSLTSMTEKMARKGLKQVDNYSWAKTSTAIISRLAIDR